MVIRTAPSRLSLAAAGLLVSLVVAVGVSACGGDGAPATSAAQNRPQALTQHQRAVLTNAAERVSTRASREARILVLPDRGNPVLWLRKGKQTEIRTGPGGGEVLRTVGRQTEFGSLRVFSVVRTVSGWAGVPTPIAKNGVLGWVKLDPGVMKAGSLPNEVVVDLSAFRAELLHGQKVVRSFPITIGAPGSPTPTGRFAVTDTFRGGLDPAAYGCCALALSAIQPALPSGWLGGNRIAIHGTTGPLSVAASHGCVRVANDDASFLVAKAPPGTPVIIHE
jgi:hypothetical protein